jgi:hypothetical protein
LVGRKRCGTQSGTPKGAEGGTPEGWGVAKRQVTAKFEICRENYKREREKKGKRVGEEIPTEAE